MWKETCAINLNSIFHLSQYIQILSFQHAINIKIITEVFSLFGTKSKSDVRFIRHGTSQFNQATFQVLSSYKWLVGTIELDSQL